MLILATEKALWCWLLSMLISVQSAVGIEKVTVLTWSQKRSRREQQRSDIISTVNGFAWAWGEHRGMREQEGGIEEGWIWEGERARGVWVRMGDCWRRGQSASLSPLQSTPFPDLLIRRGNICPHSCSATRSPAHFFFFFHQTSNKLIKICKSNVEYCYTLSVK